MLTSQLLIATSYVSASTDIFSTLTDRVGATLSVLIIFSGVAAVAEANKVFVPELRKLHYPRDQMEADHESG